MILWRISNYADLSGEGGLYFPGRWHSVGRRVIYCAETPEAALLEAIVHIPKNLIMPKEYQLLQIEIPDHRIWNFENAMNTISGNFFFNNKPFLNDDFTDKEIILFEMLQNQKSELFNWQEWLALKENIKVTQRLGDFFLQNRLWIRHMNPIAGFRVPSAITPHSWNIILNPTSYFIHEAKILSSVRYPFDTRLTS